MIFDNKHFESVNACLFFHQYILIKHPSYTVPFANDKKMHFCVFSNNLACKGLMDCCTIQGKFDLERPLAMTCAIEFLTCC